jgi:hypothetical protein
MRRRHALEIASLNFLQQRVKQTPDFHFGRSELPLPARRSEIADPVFRIVLRAGSVMATPHNPLRSLTAVSDRDPPGALQNS